MWKIDLTKPQKYEHQVVKRDGNEFILLGTWSQYHHYDYNANSDDERAFPDWAYERYSGPGIGNNPHELREEGGQFLNRPVFPDPEAFGLYDKILLDSGVQAIHNLWKKLTMRNDLLICQAIWAQD